MTPTEAADRLGVQVYTVHRLRIKGEIKGAKCPSVARNQGQPVWNFDPRSVERYLKRQDSPAYMARIVKAHCDRVGQKWYRKCDAFPNIAEAFRAITGAK